MSNSIIQQAKEKFAQLRSSPRCIFGYFLLVNLFLYVDRGLIPGASVEFANFISTVVETKDPDVFLGIVQTSFIVGLSGSVLVFGHLVHKVERFLLISIGLAVWTLSTLLAGLAGPLKSFWLLLVARILSGVGEAAFISVAPAFICDYAGNGQGTSLSLFFTMIPFGTALGFGLGALMSGSSSGWPAAFYAEVVVGILLTVICLNLKESRLGLVAASRLYPATTGDSPRGHMLGGSQSPTFFGELKTVTGTPEFLCVIAGYASYAAVVIGFSTFGAAFVLDLGLFENEIEASVTLGVVVAVAAVVGTPCGGVLLDRYVPDISSDNRRVLRVRRLYETSMHIFKWSLPPVLFLIVAALLPGRVAFFTFLFLGLLLLFSTQGGVNIAIMLSVPEEYRSFAISVGTLLMHLLGDVPSPIAVGALKDVLAPHCAGVKDPSKGRTDACRGDEWGLRISLVMLSLWLLWMAVGYFSAAKLAQRRRKKIERQGVEGRAGEEAARS